MNLLDIPGFGDSKGADKLNEHELIQKFTDIKFISCFLIVINSANRRLDE